MTKINIFRAVKVAVNPEVERLRPTHVYMDGEVREVPAKPPGGLLGAMLGRIGGMGAEATMGTQKAVLHPPGRVPCSVPAVVDAARPDKPDFFNHE